MNAENVAKKLRTMANAIVSEKGSVDFLGLFLREEASGFWDIVVSANWLKRGDYGSYKYVADHVQKLLNESEILDLSKIMILDHDGRVSRDLSERFEGKYGWVSGSFAMADGEIVSKAFIVVAKKLPLVAVIDSGVGIASANTVIYGNGFGGVNSPTPYSVAFSPIYDPYNSTESSLYGFNPHVLVGVKDTSASPESQTGEVKPTITPIQSPVPFQLQSSEASS